MDVAGVEEVLKTSSRFQVLRTASRLRTVGPSRMCARSSTIRLGGREQGQGAEDSDGANSEI
jgi:hypothetical protein